MLGDDRPDSELIAASLTNPELFSAIFDRHYAAVFGFAGAAVGVTSAPDVASEVLLRAFQLRHRYNMAYPSARPWLLGIASNLVSDHFRRRARQQRAYHRWAGRETPTIEFEEEAAERSDARAVSAVLRKALESLRAEEVSVVALFVLEEMSYHEIADVLAIPIGTVRSRLSRARRRLRNQIGSGDEFLSGGTDE